MSQYSAAGLRYNAATRQQRAMTQLAIRPGMRGMDWVAIQFCIVTGGKRRPRCDTAHQRACKGNDTATIRSRGPAT